METTKKERGREKEGKAEAKKGIWFFNSDFCASLKITSKPSKYLMARQGYLRGRPGWLVNFPRWTASFLGLTRLLSANISPSFQIRGLLQGNFRESLPGIPNNRNKFADTNTQRESRVLSALLQTQHRAASFFYPTPTHSLSFMATKGHSSSCSWYNDFYRCLRSSGNHHSCGHITP